MSDGQVRSRIRASVAAMTSQVQAIIKRYWNLTAGPYSPEAAMSAVVTENLHLAA
jgi:hypothetical protein